MMKSTEEDNLGEDEQLDSQQYHHQHQDREYYSSLDMDGYDEETLNGNSTLCGGDREEMTGSPAVRLKELRLTLLCWCFSIKFFQVAFCAAFTFIAIQWDDLNNFMSNHFWTGIISCLFSIASYYGLKRVRYCRRFPINLLLLIGWTIFMAFTFSVLAVHISPYSYIVLVALITAATIFFTIIPAALFLEVHELPLLVHGSNENEAKQVDENGFGMYKHMVATSMTVVIFSQLPYFLSIGPRYNVDYGIYMVNVCSGAVLGSLLCLEGLYFFKRHMNSGRQTSLANLEGIFSASVS